MMNITLSEQRKTIDIQDVDFAIKLHIESFRFRCKLNA